VVPDPPPLCPIQGGQGEAPWLTALKIAISATFPHAMSLQHSLSIPAASAIVVGSIVRTRATAEALFFPPTPLTAALLLHTVDPDRRHAQHAASVRRHLIGRIQVRSTTRGPFE